MLWDFQPETLWLLLCLLNVSCRISAYAATCYTGSAFLSLESFVLLRTITRASDDGFKEADRFLSHLTYCLLLCAVSRSKIVNLIVYVPMLRDLFLYEAQVPYQCICTDSCCQKLLCLLIDLFLGEIV